MVCFYCKKCNINSPSEDCCRCGKKLPQATMRDVWRVYRSPVGDRNAWRAAMGYLCTAVLICAVIIIALSYILPEGGGIGKLLQSGVLSAVALLFPAGMAGVLLFLALQGKEILDYSLDARGAHLRSLQGPGRLRSYTRLQSAPLQALEGSASGMAAISQERHLLWEDIQQLIFKPDRGEILLYAGGRVAPFILRLPPEEYDDAERFVKKHCKKILKSA